MNVRKALNLLSQLSSPDESKSERASEALSEIVNEAVEKETQSGKRLRSLDALESRLTTLLSDPVELDAERKEEFIYSLISIVRSMARRARIVVPALCGIFLAAHQGTSGAAAEALAFIVFENDNSDALDALISGTDHKYNPEVRRAAVTALGLLGKRGSKVQPLLRELLNDEDLEVRKAAIIALQNQRECARPVVHELVEMLKRDNELTDYLQEAVVAITGKPSPISWPRKARALFRGWLPFDDPRYSSGWNFITL